MSSTIIDTPDALAPYVESLQKAEWLAVDSEGDGFHRYRSRLCMVQLAADGDARVVDPLAIEDIGPMAPLLTGDTPVKVLHDVSFDVKMLAGRGIGLGKVFDTSVAARYLSEPSTGLAALLSKYLDVDVDKGFQQADWGERPITDERLRYLLDDVRYLVTLARRLKGLAGEVDILDEIEEETRYAMRRALLPEAVRAPWTRIKARKELRGYGLALLAALADAREAEAQEVDVPPFRVAPNAALQEAARRSVKTVRELKRVRGLRRMSSERLESALEAAKRDGPPVEPTVKPPPPEMRKLRKAREKALTEWRTKEAARRDVDVQVILPGHCLRDMAGLEDLEALVEVDGLGEKRLTLYRDRLLELL